MSWYEQIKIWIRINLNILIGICFKYKTGIQTISSIWINVNLPRFPDTMINNYINLSLRYTINMSNCIIISIIHINNKKVFTFKSRHVIKVIEMLLNVHRQLDNYMNH